MKYLITSSILVIIIILCVLFYPFELFRQEKISYDDEQKGLSDQITIRFSHVVAENTPKGLAAQKFAHLASDKTNGLVNVEVVPNGTLYTDEEELDALIKNDVQMIAPSVSKMTNLAPEWGLFDLPFLFQTNEDVTDVFTSGIGKNFLKLHEDENIKGMALWSNGMKQMTSSVKALKVPEDFIGQRFRIMPSEIIAEQFRRLEAVPIPMPFDQLYVSLEADKFEGQENTISNIYSRRLYELQNYMTISNHGFLGYVVLMNKDFWNSLPKGVQTSLTEAMDETTDWMIKESMKMNKQQLQVIDNESMIEIHYLTDEEREAWLNKLMPVYHTLYDQVNEEFVKDFIEQRIEEMERE
ncbi:C4-dicarboxylate ABC transporter [Bacillus sp. SA1-12]|uniref:DctP family TRAP transporter solute-binding subunit n=1 Tax=Bacillus sp. SA1-12 TaxID=1455638 RepID=UPI000626FA48|nr:DctP family TRAP transporter solute-binding subunit [Bacillus sp. SA1-12]KKI89927.1 C4-dicarboxylate ABC transporter [Bacillus sp. SA1-12]